MLRAAFGRASGGEAVKDVMIAAASAENASPIRAMDTPPVKDSVTIALSTRIQRPGRESRRVAPRVRSSSRQPAPAAAIVKAKSQSGALYVSKMMTGIATAAVMSRFIPGMQRGPQSHLNRRNDARVFGTRQWLH